MIYENSVIFKIFVRSDSKEKYITKNIIKGHGNFLMKFSLLLFQKHLKN